MANHEYILLHFSEDEKAILEPYLNKLDDLFEKHNNYKRTDEFFKNNLVGLTDFYADKLIGLYRDYYARVPIFESYFPEFCEEYPEYMAFLHSACVIFNELFNKVATFNYLVNADRVPAGFINALAAGLGYEFKENVPVVYQRELLKRLLNIYKCRGSEADIILKGQQYNNEGYLGGRLFVPGTYKAGYAMSITFPREDLFIWSQSTRSTKYRYPDIDYYRDGLISFNTPIINDDIKEAVSKVVPAGVTIVFTYMLEAPYPFDGVVGQSVDSLVPTVETHEKSLYFDNVIHTFDYNYGEGGLSYTYDTLIYGNKMFDSIISFGKNSTSEFNWSINTNRLNSVYGVLNSDLSSYIVVYFQIDNEINFIRGHKYFISFIFDGDLVKLPGNFYFHGGTTMTGPKVPLSLGLNGVIETCTGDITSKTLRFYLQNTSNPAAIGNVGQYVSLTDIVVVDLTDLFGDGREPNVAELLNLLRDNNHRVNYNCFDGPDDDICLQAKGNNTFEHTIWLDRYGNLIRP